MEEEITALIPEVGHRGKHGLDSYAIFITTKRLVFIQTKKGHNGLGFIYGAIGSAIASAIESYFDKKKPKLKLNQNIDL
ncbi:MAG: hypothetical protein KAI64_02210, partial [Thermoplasmata archaeon]|nr:hypothetical protein [Thermoplasmata archaeon]